MYVEKYEKNWKNIFNFIENIQQIFSSQIFYACCISVACISAPKRLADVVNKKRICSIQIETSLWS
jgi:hypothetical protein